MRIIYMPTGMLSAWGLSCTSETWSPWHCQVGTTSSKLGGPAGYSEPNSWDLEDEDEMDEILYHTRFHPFHPRLLDYGYGFSYVHLRVMALFFPYPNLALQRIRLSCWNSVRRWERIGSDSWKMWRAFAPTSSIRPAVTQIQTSHTNSLNISYQLSRLAVSDTNGFDLLMEG